MPAWPPERRLYAAPVRGSHGPWTAPLQVGADGGIHLGCLPAPAGMPARKPAWPPGRRRYGTLADFHSLWRAAAAQGRLRWKSGLTEVSNLGCLPAPAGMPARKPAWPPGRRRYGTLADFHSLWRAATAHQPLRWKSGLTEVSNFGYLPAPAGMPAGKPAWPPGRRRYGTLAEVHAVWRAAAAHGRLPYGRSPERGFRGCARHFRAATVRERFTGHGYNPYLCKRR